ncbi:MAG: ATP-dependent helicase [Nanoarchaeota archaeon]
MSITQINKPNTDEQIYSALNKIVGTWFKNKFKTFSDPQKYAILPIHKKENVLVSAVTGSGKTLTAFTSVLNELISLSEKNKLENRVYAVYVSPLKSLASDININLISPLNEMEEQEKKKLGIRIGLRTGDTTQTERQKMLKNPPHILITTSESLALMLSSYKFVELLKDVQYFIMDELHSFAENKRGTHLAISLERLQHISPNMTRIGLSATAEPIEELAQFLVGSDRHCKIARVDLTKKLDVKVISPVDDLINITQNQLHHKLYSLLDNLIEEHKTTLIFTNTRSATERVVHHLKDKFPKKYIENIAAHHGSLSKKHRLDVEDRLRDGKLKAVVCSTSLELGIDIGFIDLVVLLGSPKSVARGSQRVGRSGHRLHDTIKGRFVVLDRDDLVESSLLLKDMVERKIDKIHIPKNCLDVLAQQIYGIAIQDRWNINNLFRLIKQAYPYKNLSRKDFDEVIKYLAGEYSSLENRYIYAKIWHDKETKMIGRRGKLARVLYMTNIGTIPDETSVKVKIKDQIIGSIDEAFLERLKRGDVFVLGGNTYQFLFSRGTVAQVIAAPEKNPTVPSWFSEMLPLSFDLANDIQKFRLYIEDLFINKKTKEEIIKFINEYLYVEENAANAIYEYFREQFLYSEIPTSKKLIIEFYQGEDKKKYAVFHSLYGRRVNDVLSRAVAYAIAKIQKRDVEIGINDNGFYLASYQNMQILRAFELLKPDNLEEVMKRAIEKTEVLKRRFRHCAIRSLMILRSYKGRTKKVGRQTVSSMILLKAVKAIDKDFSILKEARREVLQDLMDLDNAINVLKDIKSKKIEIKQIHTQIPTPFAFNLVLQGYTDVMKMEDKIEFLRRMHNNVLAKIYQK